ncbi:aconitate hydratase 1 [Salmonella enterica subsp. enterica]|uniref:Aconitate hydratase 1 n=1 Tax=Salmonella enterica I TaxID=59201 RepID=A0A447N9J2_SALET|nr:aconitate hydratase 1 [Salmonella enterica subsp. enterica]
MRLSGRSDDLVELVETYAKAQGMWRNPGDEPVFTSTLELDMGDVEASLAGPKTPAGSRSVRRCAESPLPPAPSWS